jgi:uncharacterized protein (TIGR02598 family)
MRHRPRSRVAFSLIELTLAMGIAAVSLLTIFGLLATGLQINHTSTGQTASAEFLTTVASDLRATPGNTNTSLQFGITIPANITLYLNAAGQSSTTLNSDSRYRLDVTFLPGGGGRTATPVNLRMTWPAGADPSHANTRASEMFVALDRN